MIFKDEALSDLFLHLPSSSAWIDSKQTYRFVTPSYAELFRKEPKESACRKTASPWRPISMKSFTALM